MVINKQVYNLRYIGVSSIRTNILMKVVRHLQKINKLVWSFILSYYLLSDA